MSEKQTSPSPKKDSESTSKPDHGQAEIQQAHDAANAQGYWGTVPDETPNEAYTVAGVIKAAKEAKGGK